MIDRDTAVKEIRRNWRSLLPMMTRPAKARINGEISYVCPVCGNGSGKDGTGLTFVPEGHKTRDGYVSDGNTLKCFGGGCMFGSGDIIDLRQAVTGQQLPDVINDLAMMLGIDIEPKKQKREEWSYSAQAEAGSLLSATETAQDAADADKREPPAQGRQRKNVDPGASEPVKEVHDYSDYIRQCEDRLTDPAALAYLERRGISLKSARKYRCGYDPEFVSPAAIRSLEAKGNDWRPAPTPRLIMPADSNTAYVARDTRQNLSERDQKYKKINEGTVLPSGMEALDGDQPVFVVEGVIDAMSIAEAGGVAVALNSTANADSFAAALKTRKLKSSIILALDADKAGKACSRNLAAALNKLDIDFIVADVCGSYSDPNDALVNDRQQFCLAVQEAVRQTSSRPDSVIGYLESGGLDADIDAFTANVRSTGFFYLDELSGGGLHTGLYMIASVPSLGKTTFCYQLADYLATNGAEVLYFALEQGRSELVLKSLARRAAIRDAEEGNSLESQTLSSAAMRMGYYKSARIAAAEQFKLEVGSRLSIVEGGISVDAEYISQYVRRYIRRNHVAPVVALDYLQLLKAPEGIHDIREGLIETSRILRTLVREQNLTMICISSINRSNYGTEFDYESMKESGSLEYDADFVGGLQLEAIHDPEIQDDKKNVSKKRERLKAAKKEKPRHVELTVVKNRYGPSSFSDHFLYYPAAELFVEDEERNREDAEELDQSMRATKRKR